MIGSQARFVTARGDRVTAVCFDVRSDLPRYDVEVVRDGEVIEHIEDLCGSYALMTLASRRGWKETA